MNMHNRIKLITYCVLATVSSFTQAAQLYDSDYTNQIHGFMPIIPSVGPYLFQAENPTVIYKASENGNIKAEVKVGDKLTVPTSLKEEAYNLYYSWADADGVGQYSDIEDKENINLSFEWYLVKDGSSKIIPDVSAEKLQPEDGVLTDSSELGPTYIVGPEAVGKKIGFRIKAYSQRGLPKEGIYLDVPNIAYLGQQIGSTDPSVLPETVQPDADDESTKHPDIADKTVNKGDDYIIRIKDITQGEAAGKWLQATDPIYVTHIYKAYVQKWDEETNRYQESTESLEQYITWNLYLKNDVGPSTPIYEYMTAKGVINNIPSNPAELAAFDLSKNVFTYDDQDKAEIAARFVEGNNQVFKIQNTNSDALPKTKVTPENYSEQNLELKVKLIVP